MTHRILALILAILVSAPASLAQQQDTVWVQIEAKPSLSEARESIRDYAARLQDVNGFALGSGWYAVALGPFTPEDAARVLQVYRAEGVIPQDSYVALGTAYGQQFWPVGSSLSDQAPQPEPALPDAGGQDTLAQEDRDAPNPAPDPEETRSEARASERELDRDDRADLQTALKWAGFYQGPIDAAFGRGTRGAMAAWQRENGFDPTGVLTTRQRAILLRRYNAVLEGLGLETVRDDEAGIEMVIPTDIVEFDRYEPPFAHYVDKGDIDARVLLISQEGDRNTLAGLYDIMQTLEIVPESGPRTLEEDAFTLIGEGATAISHTQAWLKDGRIKGFTLVWPVGDEERRARLLGEMQESFTRLGGVLDPAAGSSERQSIDLVSGLAVRRPVMSRSGFFVDGTGTVVTTSDVVEACGRITLDNEHEAEIAARDDTLGVAVLKPLQPLAPMSVATFRRDVPRLESEIAVAGYSYGGVLGAPTLTFGRLAELRGLDGTETLTRLDLAALEGDAGGPVVDTDGAVLGMLLSSRDTERALPEDVRFAADARVVQDLVRQAGSSTDAASAPSQVTPATLRNRAVNMTVLVSCWE